MGVALNQDGVVLAEAYRRDGTERVPFVSKGGRVLVLRSSFRLRVWALGMNKRGDVVGKAVRTLDPPNFSPVLWRRGKEVAFPTFPGWTLQTAQCINDKGQICGTGLHEGKTRAYVISPLVRRLRER